MKFASRSTIVTGGAGALGRVVVQEFLREGAQVAVPVFSPGDVQLFSDLSPGWQHNLFASVCNLSVPSEVEDFVASAVGRTGSVDFLVNLAGGYAGGKLVEETSPEEWERMLSSNLTSAFLVVRAVLPHMRQKGYGRIISIAAATALRPAGRQAAYSVAKRGVITLTEALADEVRGSGITANCIAPSIILTDANRQAMPDADTRLWVTPEEIAWALTYLCSDEAQSVNGTTLRITGGL